MKKGDLKRIITIVSAFALILGFFLGGWAKSNSYDKCSEELANCKIVLNESMDLNKDCMIGVYELAKRVYNFTDNEKQLFDYLIYDEQGAKP